MSEVVFKRLSNGYVSAEVYGTEYFLPPNFYVIDDPFVDGKILLSEVEAPPVFLASSIRFNWDDVTQAACVPTITAVNEAEVITELQTKIFTVPGVSGNSEASVNNNLPANTEVALRNPDGSPWLVGGKQVFAKLIEATTTGGNFVVLAENVDVVVSVTSLLRNQGNPSFQGLSGLNSDLIVSNYRSQIGLSDDDIVLDLATDDDGTWNVRAVIQYTKL